MATPDERAVHHSPNLWHEVDVPPFRKEIVDLKFVNISIKCYEKKIGTGFKEEYYAYKIISMYVNLSISIYVSIYLFIYLSIYILCELYGRECLRWFVSKCCWKSLSTE